MIPGSGGSTLGWLAFELSVLKRLKFSSATIPFNARPNLGLYLKRSGIRVLANDPMASAYEDCFAHIVNDGVTLSPEDIGTVLEDAYVPGYELNNPALRNWFGETDAWWFDNVRSNIENLGSREARSLALSVGFKVGDYVHSFNDETRRLRQPLSKVFERLASLEETPVSNGQENNCQCSNPVSFTAESKGVDLFFLRLPPARRDPLRESLGSAAWREAWVRGGDDFWHEIEEDFGGRLGARIETKAQYLEMIADALGAAGHIKRWAIEHVEDGFIQTHDIVDIIGKNRRVDTVFTKDFSELTGVKAVMVTA